MPLSPPPDLARLWPLDPTIDFLNHGSYGACPRAVLDAQQQWRERMERQPVLFLGRELETRLDDARAVLARFIGADPDDLAFVPNTTSGTNAVLRSLRLERGDELLVTDHGYNAVRNTVDFAAANAGAHVVVARVPFPLHSPDEVVDAVMKAVTPGTRLAVLDHVTSPTGLVFPLERLVRNLREHGVETLVDGAHAPGMVELDLRALGAAYFTGNGHKWLCAPKGSAFLHVRRDRQDTVRPLAISHGANATRTDRSRFRLEFDWTGTDDPTPYLCLADAIRYMDALLPGGWPAVTAANRALALGARRTLCAALGVAPPCPDEMIGSLAAVPIADGPAPRPRGGGDGGLQGVLFDRYRIEVPIMPWPAPPRRLVRISAQLYNRPEQYARLARALVDVLSGP